MNMILFGYEEKGIALIVRRAREVSRKNEVVGQYKSVCFPSFD